MTPEDHPDAAMILNNIMTIFCVNRVRPEQARAILQDCLSKLTASRSVEKMA